MQMYVYICNVNYRDDYQTPLFAKLTMMVWINLTLKKNMYSHRFVYTHIITHVLQIHICIYNCTD